MHACGAAASRRGPMGSILVLIMFVLAMSLGLTGCASGPPTAASLATIEPTLEKPVLQKGEYAGIYFGGTAKLYLSVREVNGTASKGLLYIATPYATQQYGLNQDISFVATQEGD